MSKTYPNSVAAAAYSDKAYALFSSWFSHLVRPKDKPPKQNGLVYRIPRVNAVKSTSARLEDLCKTESKNISETPDLSVPRLPPFPNTLTIPDTTRFGTE